MLAYTGTSIVGAAADVSGGQPAGDYFIAYASSVGEVMLDVERFGPSAAIPAWETPVPGSMRKERIPWYR
jgi:hypothetical protein